MSTCYGFVGLGHMGTPMAGRLLDAGHHLVVTDVSPQACARATERGAEVVGSAREVADRAEVVLASLPSPTVVRTVALAEDGVAAGGAVRMFLDLSTIGSPTARAVAEGLEKQGVAYVDAPVSGGVSGASAGTLAVMVACGDEEFAASRPVLEHLGKVFHVGREPGMGQAMKLVNNYLSAAALVTTTEATVVGVRAGLDPAAIIDVLNASSGRNSATQDKFPRAVLPGTFDFGFAMGLMDKDLGLFVDEADQADVSLWVGSALRQMWRHACRQLGADVDFTRFVTMVEQWAGAEVRSQPAATS